MKRYKMTLSNRSRFLYTWQSWKVYILNYLLIVLQEITKRSLTKRNLRSLRSSRCHIIEDIICKVRLNFLYEMSLYRLLYVEYWISIYLQMYANLGIEFPGPFACFFHRIYPLFSGTLFMPVVFFSPFLPFYALLIVRLDALKLLFTPSPSSSRGICLFAQPSNNLGYFAVGGHRGDFLPMLLLREEKI